MCRLVGWLHTISECSHYVCVLTGLVSFSDCLCSRTFRRVPNSRDSRRQGSAPRKTCSLQGRIKDISWTTWRSFTPVVLFLAAAQPAVNVRSKYLALIFSLCPATSWNTSVCWECVCLFGLFQAAEVLPRRSSEQGAVKHITLLV